MDYLVNKLISKEAPYKTEEYTSELIQQIVKNLNGKPKRDNRPRFGVRVRRIGWVKEWLEITDTHSDTMLTVMPNINIEGCLSLNDDLMQFNHDALKVADKAEIEAFVANVFSKFLQYFNRG